MLHKYGLPGRIVAGVLRNLLCGAARHLSGQLTLRAMSLVYTTLLSVVPLIAVSFSVLKGFGVDKDLEQYLYGVLEPLGEKGVEITEQVMDLVNNVNGSVLGGIGLAFLSTPPFRWCRRSRRALTTSGTFPSHGASRPLCRVQCRTDRSAHLRSRWSAHSHRLAKRTSSYPCRKTRDLGPIFELTSSLTPYP